MAKIRAQRKKERMNTKLLSIVRAAVKEVNQYHMTKQNFGLKDVVRKTLRRMNIIFGKLLL